ncbi:MAG: theronine dehydrogenase [Actinomycetia bacterium]|nr:theronine dehydrogenase [Actinomycetes bacterium]
MKLLWHDEWIEAPGYEVPEAGVLIEVLASVPLVKLTNASGRQQRRPGRKVAVFLVTDGPYSTLRKARTKREEPKFTGDLHVGLVLGEVVGTGRRVVALAPRVPTCSQQVVVHHELASDVADDFASASLERAAARLAPHARTLNELARQNFLYSGMTPPEQLTALLAEAVRPAADGPAVTGDAPAAVIPPKGDGKAADTVLRLKPAPSGSGIPAAVLGGGDYTRTEIIPGLRHARLSLYAVANREPQIAALVGRQFGFALATTDSERAIAELPAPGLVVVATAHDSHAHLACAAVEAGHRVFLEKPPTVTPEDVTRLATAMRANPGAVEIGFNRRYHPLIRRAKARLGRESGPTTITCVVKELNFQRDHWYFWPNQGTRVTGNLCHWIDLAVYLLEGSPLPVSVTMSPRVPGSEPGSDEERVLVVTFEDGSLFTALGTTRGDDIRGVQEYMDIRRGLTSIAIDDLWKARTLSEGIGRSSRTLFRDKAHTRMYREGLGRIAAGQPSMYSTRDMVVVSAIQIAASDLVRTDQHMATLPEWLALAKDD